MVRILYFVLRNGLLRNTHYAIRCLVFGTESLVHLVRFPICDLIVHNSGKLLLWQKYAFEN